jgi:hypothetical protein
MGSEPMTDAADSEPIKTAEAPSFMRRGVAGGDGSA